MKVNVLGRPRISNLITTDLTKNLHRKHEDILSIRKHLQDFSTSKIEKLKPLTPSPSPQKFGVSLILMDSFPVRISGERGASVEERGASLSFPQSQNRQRSFLNAW